MQEAKNEMYFEMKKNAVRRSIGVLSTMLKQAQLQQQEEYHDAFISGSDALLMADAKSLLIATELPVEDVGWRTGFGGSKNLIRQFKLATGMTPGEYRRQCIGWDNAHAGAERRS